MGKWGKQQEKVVAKSQSNAINVITIETSLDESWLRDPITTTCLSTGIHWNLSIIPIQTAPQSSPLAITHTNWSWTHAPVPLSPSFFQNNQYNVQCTCSYPFRTYPTAGPYFIESPAVVAPKETLCSFRYSNKYNLSTKLEDVEYRLVI